MTIEKQKHKTKQYSPNKSPCRQIEYKQELQTVQ